jgi:hypothetical protein
VVVFVREAVKDDEVSTVLMRRARNQLLVIQA